MAAPSDSLRHLIVRLFEIGVVKFGQFQLKSGIMSPIYFDLRIVISFPDVLELLTEIMWEHRPQSTDYQSVCGVPYTALPIATVSVHRRRRARHPESACRVWCA